MTAAAPNTQIRVHVWDGQEETAFDANGESVPSYYARAVSLPATA